MGTTARNAFAAAVLCVCVLLSAGCAAKVKPGVPPSFTAYTPPPELAAPFKKMEAEGERNWVLNLQTLAYAALRSGNREVAKQALDEAILQIETIYGNSPEARRARSAFYAENSKIFKGDPYERAMVYFYRGVLYMQDGDWDNARASFRSAQIQDAFVEEQQNQGDWILFDYLVGVCELQMNDEDAAEDAFQLASNTFNGFDQRYGALNEFAEDRYSNKSRLGLSGGLVPFTQDDNLIVITQHGRAPRKVPEGNFGQFQGYRPGGPTDSSAQVVVNGEPIGRPQPVDSVYYQAVTRGGREIDRLLGRKAFFKGAGQDVGEVGMYAGGFLLLNGLADENEDTTAVGLAALAIGATTYGISSLVKPEADVRYTHSLPDHISLYVGKLPPGQHEVGVHYLGAVRTAPGNESAFVPIDVGQNQRELNVLLTFPPPSTFIVYPVEAESMPVVSTPEEVNVQEAMQ